MLEIFMLLMLLPLCTLRDNGKTPPPRRCLELEPMLLPPLDGDFLEMTRGELLRERFNIGIALRQKQGQRSAACMQQGRSGRADTMNNADRNRNQSVFFAFRGFSLAQK